MVSSSDLRRLSLFLLAILILRVAALYDTTKWVGRFLWALSGLLYIITLALAVTLIKAFYSKSTPAGIEETLSPTSPQIKLCTNRCPGCAYCPILPSHPMGPLLSR